MWYTVVIINRKGKVSMFNLTPIENDGCRVLLTSQLAECYGTTPDVISNNFNRNKARYEVGKHYFFFEGEAKREFLNLHQFDDGSMKHSKTLYLWTERGALLHAKSLNTDKAWDVYDELVETYFKAQKLSTDLSKLSPELQYLIKLEVEQNRQVELIRRVDAKVEAIRELVALNPTSWREECNKLIVKIAMAKGTPNGYREVRNEIYSLVDSRGGADLHDRLNRRRKRMAEEGISKTKVNGCNIVDVIAEDKRITELYIKIVSEMAIKYNVC